MINEKLKNYIEENILPIYNKNDEGHNLSHIEYVIRRSLMFASEIDDINYDMVYTIAAYHDVCIHINREEHEYLSGKFLKKDNNLKEYFNEEQIILMSEAIEDHRASSDSEPRSIYGKIVSSADRNTQIENPFKRTFSYRIKKNPNYPLEKIIEESYNHLKEKYGHNGYATTKMYFNDQEYKEHLTELNKLLANKELFTKKYYEINKIDPKEYELRRVRRLCEEVKKLANSYDLEYFFITEGASSCHIKNNEAIRNARKKHEEWELSNGFDPKHDWSEKNAK